MHTNFWPIPTVSSPSLLVRTAKPHRHRGADASLYPIPLTPQALTNPLAFPGGSVVKNPPAGAGGARDASLIPGLERSPGGGSNNPVQYSYLKNSMGRGAWCAAVHGIAESRTWLSTQHTPTHTHTHTHTYTHTDLKVCGLMTRWPWVGRDQESGMWALGHRSRDFRYNRCLECGLEVGEDSYPRPYFFFLTVYFCFAESLCCTWAFSRFLMMLLSLQTME